jgi:hypothetical protein
MDSEAPTFVKRNRMLQHVYSLYVSLSCGSEKIPWDGHNDNRDVKPMHYIRATCQVALRAATVCALDRLKVLMKVK